MDKKLVDHRGHRFFGADKPALAVDYRNLVLVEDLSGIAPNRFFGFQFLDIESVLRSGRARATDYFGQL